MKRFLKVAKSGFTLAEVLITLGIIGVVAAITIPTLMQKQIHRETEVKLEKFYSIFNQAVKNSTLDNADISTWDFTLPASVFVDKYLRPYLQIVEVVENVELTGYYQGNKYILADGTAFSLPYWANGSYHVVFYPKNPKNCPSNEDAVGKFGICSFDFLLNPSKNMLYTYAPTNNYTSGGPDACGMQGVWCTGAIVNNGWKIPNDYPLKIKY